MNVSNITSPLRPEGRAEPTRVGFAAFMRSAFEFARDRVYSHKLMRDRYGPFAVARPPRPLPGLMAFLVGERFNRDIFSDTEVWRTFKIDRVNKEGHASERLTHGILREPSGPRHKHYRKVIAPALSNETVARATGSILRAADAEVGQWPTGEAVDVWVKVRQLMQVLAVSTLFGNERSRGCPMAEQLNDLSMDMLSLSTIWCPIDTPGVPYHRVMRRAEQVEHDIIDWAKEKRGEKDPKHLLSLLVNSPDENGKTPDLTAVAGHIPTLLGGAFESSMSSTFWILVLLSQYPKVAADLVDEVRALDINSPDVADQFERLDLLDRVVKEGMRILPAVPIQARISREATHIAGYPVPKRTYAFISTFCNNREPDVYSNPDAFLPERWETIRPNQFQYLTFSAGARKCPGYWYGLAAVKAGVATILRHYRVDFTDAVPINPRVSVILYPRKGAMAVLRPQDQAQTPSRIRGAVGRLVPLAG